MRNQLKALIPLAGLIVVAGFYIASIHQMSWGTIDDAYLWELAHDSRPFLDRFRWLVQQELTDWGRFRPVFILFFMGGYKSFETWPQGFYALNALLLLLAAFAISAIWLRAFQPREESFPRIQAGFAASALFAFHPWTKLFIHLSLQEKLGFLVFPFVAANLIKLERQGGHGGWRRWVAFFSWASPSCLVRKKLSSPMALL